MSASICKFASMKNISDKSSNRKYINCLKDYQLGVTHSYTLGGAVAQSVERVTPGEEVLGSIASVAARSLLVGLVSV